FTVPRSATHAVREPVHAEYRSGPGTRSVPELRTPAFDAPAAGDGPRRACRRAWLSPPAGQEFDDGRSTGTDLVSRLATSLAGLIIPLRLIPLPSGERAAVRAESRSDEAKAD